MDTMDNPFGELPWRFWWYAEGGVPVEKNPWVYESGIPDPSHMVPAFGPFIWCR